MKYGSVSEVSAGGGRLAELAGEGPPAGGRVAALVGLVEAAVEDLVAELAGAGVYGVARAEGAGLQEAVAAVGRVEARLGAASAALVTAGEHAGLPGRVGAATTGQWLARSWRVSGRSGARRAGLAQALADHPEVWTALAAGEISVEHAEGVVDGLARQAEAAAAAERAARAADAKAAAEREAADRAAAEAARNRAERRAMEALARRRAAEAARKAEQARRAREAQAAKDAAARKADLLGQAAAGDSPDQVRRTGRRAAASEEALCDREATARRHRSVEAWIDHEAGLGRGRWAVPLEHHDALMAALEALNTPDPKDIPEELRRTPAQRRADAFTDLIGRVCRAGDLPVNGGVLPQLSVQIPAGALMDAPELGGHGLPGITGFGAELSAAAVKRIGCDSIYSRVVTAGTSQVLDVGRATRQWSTAQRRAIVLRDGCCRFPGCTRPAGWTQIHHIAWWRHGGRTDLTNGVLLCAFHHGVVHHDGWTLTLGAHTGIVTVTKGDITLTSKPAIRPCPPDRQPA